MENKKNKLPALQFYVGDWMKDPAVRSVSIEARGLWVDMLCLMHESKKRGYLQHSNGEQITDLQLSRIAGIGLKKTKKLLQELKKTQVFYEDAQTGRFCKRMVLDEQKRQFFKSEGKKGGNPALTLPLTPPVKAKLTPSSSSSFSSSISENTEREDTGKNTGYTVQNQTKAFEKPDIETIKKFLEEIGGKTSAETFFNYYEANGWKVGRNPMKNWKAAVRHWESKNKQQGQSKAEKTIAQIQAFTEKIKKIEEGGENANRGF